MSEKIGRYTEDEILEHLTEGEGRSFLGRSMYDAIFDKIHALKTKNEQLNQKYEMQKDSNKLLCKAIICDDCNCSVCEAHKKNIELQQRIDEAVEYIKYCQTSDDDIFPVIEAEKMLEILRGGINE